MCYIGKPNKDFWTVSFCRLGSAAGVALKFLFDVWMVMEYNSATFPQEIPFGTSKERFGIRKTSGIYCVLGELEG
jgi:hypothetical protein